jgi:hypothetical protein
MCVEIIMPDGSTVETMGEARVVFPTIVGSPVYREGFHRECEDRVCCCSIDVARTAEANGYGWEYTNSLDFQLTRTTAV